ncbi:MAG TPA: MBL fold metallo-hydrolase [Bacteroidia bacterium]|nr:MBL fold metallo-hydrolase [Bacteroidia bacterium]
MNPVQQLYTSCLAQGAYYISHQGEAAIIDPLRETGPYLEMINSKKDKLKYIFETHFHADFVSGHVDLAAETGAEIVFGPGASTSYPSHIAKDGEVFRIGGLSLRVLHTPGHTLESSCFLLSDEQGKEICLFTGDTLFIGDVGRPDLAIKSDLSQEDLAGMLYDSLRNKIMPLPDSLIIYPAHGAGSACGKNMSKETSDTLGQQKRVNYALQDISKADFIRELTTGILPPPQYFSKNAALNKSGYAKFSDVIKQGMKALSVDEFENGMAQKNSLVLDVRSADEFAEAHIPGALFIGLDGQFAPWAGTLIQDLNTPIYLICPAGREEETILRLSRVGYDNCKGYLKGGLKSWIDAGKTVRRVNTLSAEEFFEHYKRGMATLDVRRPGEVEASRLKHAVPRALDFIEDWKNTLDKNSGYLVHCAGGYRSMIAISILENLGYSDLRNVNGGFNGFKTLAAKELVSESLPV